MMIDFSALTVGSVFMDEEGQKQIVTAIFTDDSGDIVGVAYQTIIRLYGTNGWR